MDKRSAVWEIMSAVKTKHASEKGNWVLETVVAGYNTRLDFEDVSKKIRNVLGDTSGSGRLQIREIYNSGKGALHLLNYCIYYRPHTISWRFCV